jgi:ribosomal protein S18 acetylase RimI-like enzyme
MLQESPGAFIETLDEIEERTAEEWKNFTIEHIESLIRAAFLAFDDEGSCGFVSCDLDDPRTVPGAAVISSLWVAAENRNSGLGYLLMQIAIDWIQKKHVTLVTLGVTGVNMHVQPFYKKLGFKHLGITIGVPGQPEKLITVLGKRI